MLSLLSILSAVLLLPSALTIPAPTFKTCRPNFQGRPVSIFSLGPDPKGPTPIAEWYAQNREGGWVTSDLMRLEALLNPEFIVEFTGSPKNTHRIKLVANTERNLAATATSDGQFLFKNAAWDATQEFDIMCDYCETDIVLANSCTVEHTDTGRCVTAKPGERLVMSACNGGAAQEFVLVQGLTPSELASPALMWAPSYECGSDASRMNGEERIPQPRPPTPPPPPPLDIDTYPSPDLLRLLASLLTQIAATNDALHTTPSPDPIVPSSTPIWDSLTTASRSAVATASSTLTFHARNIPTISLEAYLLRILKYCPTTNHVFLSLLVYFDRMTKLSADATGRPFVIDSYNIHRLVIAGVTVASKFFSDVFYTNSRYAKVGGLPLTELNQLELQFLLLNDFRLVISSAETQRYAEQLIVFSHAHSPPLLPSPGNAHAPPTAPTHAMGAFDPCGGRVPGPPHSPCTPPGAGHPKTPVVPAPTTPVLPHPPADDEAGVETETETETETEAETDADGSTTDDEPTIRPAYSSRGSECGSVRSAAPGSRRSSIRSFGGDDGDDEGGGGSDDE
ncbi:cyclin-domain-containing protein [Infundibulicybe gibba]|nr:cyclin-domain-containing protein [Infundibulicybe gibba]